MSGKALSVAMVRIGELAIRLGAAPINRLPGCWEHQVDALWWIAVNGHAEQRTITREGMAGTPTVQVGRSMYLTHTIRPLN